MAEKKNTSDSRGLKTAQNRAAAAMLLSAVGALGLLIAALAGGFAGWAWIAAAAVVILLGGGVFLLRSASRRKVAPRAVYRPDSTDLAYDVDLETGERMPHRE